MLIASPFQVLSTEFVLVWEPMWEFLRTLLSTFRFVDQNAYNSKAIEKTIQRFCWNSTSNEWVMFVQNLLSTTTMSFVYRILRTSLNLWIDFLFMWLTVNLANIFQVNVGVMGSALELCLAQNREISLYRQCQVQSSIRINSNIPLWVPPSTLLDWKWRSDTPQLYFETSFKFCCI